MALIDLDALRARPEAEGERADFPAGFPDPIDVPAARYTDEGFFALERERIFRRCWLYAGHTGQIPEAGDYVRLDAFAEPLILLRGTDGIIRCFFNTCQHRGSPLVLERTGNARLLVCPYHGWTYETGGTLRGYPEAKNFPRNTDRSCLGLKSVRCETYGSLIFINFAPEAEPLRDFLGPVADELDHLIGDKADDVHFASEELQTVAANWKLAGDANVETYHVPFLHEQSANPAIDANRTGQWLLPNGHSRMLIKYRPETAEFFRSGGTGLPRFKGISGNGLPLEGVYSFHIFPNTSIVMGSADLFFVISAVPRSAGEFRYLVHYFSPLPMGGEHEAQFRQLVAFNSHVLNEDLAVIPGIQTSMEAGGIDVLKLQYQERRIRRLHEVIDQWIGADDVPAPLRVPSLLDSHVEAR